MNYIQINEQQAPIKFGYKLVKKYMDKFKLKKWTDWTQIPSLAEIGHAPDVLKDALATGAKMAGEDFTLTIEEVEDILDSHPHIVTEMWDIFIDDMTPANKKAAVAKAMEEANEEVKN